MDTIHTDNARSLADLQKKDSVIAALKAEADGVPKRIAAINKTFEDKKASMSAAREALMALQSKKKELELGIAEADEGIRKHQRELNMVKDNNAFKALLSEIDHDKASKDELETAVIVLLDEIDRAAAADKAVQAEVKVIEGAKDGEIAALEAEGREIAARLAAAEAERSGLAGKIEPALLEKYEAVRASRAGVAVVAVQEDGPAGKLSCGGCHISLTPQKTLDVKKADTFAVCGECRRFMYLERTIYG